VEAPWVEVRQPSGTVAVLEASGHRSLQFRRGGRRLWADADIAIEIEALEVRIFCSWSARLEIRMICMAPGWTTRAKPNMMNGANSATSRDAAGKGGAIKRITQRMNPRVCRVAALPAPNERERTQWYFQRYVSHLPAGGEMVLFDRSWYNRAGVERVMGFCTDAELEEFFRDVPEFERMLVRSGIILIKYWFSITDEVQHLRFKVRIEEPLKQWKLSPMDLESRRRWEQYTKAKEAMLEHTHIPEARWWVVEAVDKKRARLNCIHHLLSRIPYEEIPREPVVLPARVHNPEYIRAPVPADMYVPSVY
jgi:polyphosphate kinase 2